MEKTINMCWCSLCNIDIGPMIASFWAAIYTEKHTNNNLNKVDGIKELGYRWRTTSSTITRLYLTHHQFLPNWAFLKHNLEHLLGQHKVVALTAKEKPLVFEWHSRSACWKPKWRPYCDNWLYWKLSRSGALIKVIQAIDRRVRHHHFVSECNRISSRERRTRCLTVICIRECCSCNGGRTGT